MLFLLEQRNCISRLGEARAAGKQRLSFHASLITVIIGESGVVEQKGRARPASFPSLEAGGVL